MRLKRFLSNDLTDTKLKIIHHKLYTINYSERILKIPKSLLQISKRRNDRLKF